MMMKKVLKAVAQFILTVLWVFYAILGKPLISIFKVPAKKKNEETVSQEYRDAVTKLAEVKKNQRFLNGTNADAKVVAGLMIARAEEADEVLVYSDALSAAFYKEVLRHSKCRIKVLLDDREGINIIKALPQDVQSRLECRVTKVAGGAHFLVSDDAFRYELEYPTHLVFGIVVQYETKHPEPHDELFVVCNFYEPRISQRLRDRFGDMWTNAVICA